MADRLPDLAAHPRRRRRLYVSSASALGSCFEQQSQRRLWQRPWESKRPKEPELQTGLGARAPLGRLE